MDTRQAYNLWSDQYDTNKNRTRDLEAQALRESLAVILFKSCLEIGCGTGKDTEWLATKACDITAVDFSEEMLAKAKTKVLSTNVQFIQADITQNWSFVTKSYDLITFSLVLEHIEHLDHIFQEAFRVLTPKGTVYIGELHPFKQYGGTKARFDTPRGQQTLTCYTHHISEFIQVAKRNGFEVIDINEFFDNDDRNTIPRILTLLLKKI